MLLHFRDLSKLKTKKVVYEETYHEQDLGTLVQLKELSLRRREVKKSINVSSLIKATGGTPSPIQQDLQKMERYLPLLENLVRSVELYGDNHQVLEWTADLKIRWTSALSASSASSLGGPKFFHMDNLRFEFGMVLFLYGAFLRKWALELMSSDLVESTTLFRKAAGVYQYLAENALPPLEPRFPSKRPPEATASMASIMSLVCLADAQAVTVRKAENKAASGGLLAKLHYGVVQFLEEASNLLKSSVADQNDISEKFRRFLSGCSILHEARSQRYIADELMKTPENLGLVVKLLRHATSKFQGQLPSKDSWKKTFRQEIDALGQMLRKCEHEYNSIWHDRLPSLNELPHLEGKRIVAPIAYKPVGLNKDFII